MISIITASFGTGLSYVAMSWLVVQNAPLDQSNTVLPVAILMICFWLPGTIFGPLMGVFVDRHSRKKAILVANGGRALLWTVAGIIFYNGISNNWLYVLSIFSGILLSLFMPAAMAYIREIVAEKHLLHANANIDMAYEIGNVVGMGSTGLWLIWFPPESSILANGLCFLVSTLFMIPVRQKIKLSAQVAKLSQVFTELMDGLIYLQRDAKTLVMYTLQLIVFVQIMTTPILIVPFAKSVLHSTVAQFGEIEAAMSVGVVLGGLIIPWLVEHYGFVKLMSLLSVVAIFIFSVFGFNHNINLAILMYFILGIYYAIWSSIITKAQQFTELAYQGRVQSAFSSLSGVFILMTYGIVDFSNEFLDLSDLYFYETALSIFALVLIGLNRKNIRH